MCELSTVQACQNHSFFLFLPATVLTRLARAFCHPQDLLQKLVTKCLKSNIKIPPKNKHYYTKKDSLIQ